MGIDKRLGRAIHTAVGMSEAEMIANPREYLRRVTEMGMAIFEQRKTSSGKRP